MLKKIRKLFSLQDHIDVSFVEFSGCVAQVFGGRSEEFEKFSDLIFPASKFIEEEINRLLVNYAFSLQIKIEGGKEITFKETRRFIRLQAFIEKRTAPDSTDINDRD